MKEHFASPIDLYKRGLSTATTQSLSTEAYLYTESLTELSDIGQTALLKMFEHHLKSLPVSNDGRYSDSSDTDYPEDSNTESD